MLRGQQLPDGHLTEWSNYRIFPLITASSVRAADDFTQLTIELLLQNFSHNPMMDTDAWFRETAKQTPTWVRKLTCWSKWRQFTSRRLEVNKANFFFFWVAAKLRWSLEKREIMINPAVGRKIILFFNILIFKIIIIFRIQIYRNRPCCIIQMKKWKRCLILIVLSFSLVIFGGFITNCRYACS